MKIRLAKGLELDAHTLATSVIATLGIRGSGKTNAAAVIAEGVLAAHIPVIVLDQVGPWFALRLARDGRTASPYDIPVLGGSHGDIGLQPNSGRQVAEALAQSNSSAVLDVSMMGKGERIRFAADFAEAFFEAKKRNRSPVLLVVEESQRFIPQMMRYSDPALARCLGAFEEIAEVGRNFGIGMVLISQRPQKISKDVLFLSDTLLAFRTLGVGERKTIAEWVKEKGVAGRDQVGDELPGLKMGTAVVWSPAIFDVYGTFDVALKATYDASSTPRGAEGAVKMKPLDLGALEQSMAAVVAEAKASDPRLLKARVAELERALAARPVAAPAKPVKAPRVVTRPALTAAEVKRFEAAIGRLVGIEGNAAELRKKVAEGCAALMAKLEIAFRFAGHAMGINVHLDPSYRANVERHVEQLRPLLGPDLMPIPERRLESESTTTLPRGEHRSLTAIAQHGAAGVTREQLTVLTGYKRSMRDLTIQALARKGFITPTSHQITVTGAGLDALGAGFRPLPTGLALLEHWRGELPLGERRVLDTVVERYPGIVTRDDIDAATGYKRSMRDLCLQKLARRKLVTVDRAGVMASHMLFD